MTKNSLWYVELVRRLISIPFKRAESGPSVKGASVDGVFLAQPMPRAGCEAYCCKSLRIAAVRILATLAAADTHRPSSNSQLLLVKPSFSETRKHPLSRNSGSAEKRMHSILNIPRTRWKGRVSISFFFVAVSSRNSCIRSFLETKSNFSRRCPPVSAATQCSFLFACQSSRPARYVLLYRACVSLLDKGRTPYQGCSS